MDRAAKPTLALLLSALALALAACGGDDEEDGATTASDTAVTTTEPETSATVPTETVETTETDVQPVEPDGGSGGGAVAPGAESPEAQPGGAGDEVPISAQALVTGRDGTLRPRTVRVPPFVAIRIQLRSADGVEYSLRGGGRSVQAGGEIQSAATTYEGLRPGERLVLSGPQGEVTVVANAEPGP